MSNFRIIDLIDGTAIAPTTSDLIETWNRAIGRTEKKTLGQFIPIVNNGYVMTLYGGWESFVPTAFVSEYIGANNYDSAMTWNSDFTQVSVVIPRDGTIKFVYYKVRLDVVGTNDGSFHHTVNIDNVSNIAAKDATYDVNTIDLFDDTVNTAVFAGHQIAMQVDVPDIAIQPIGTRWYCMIYIE